MPTISRFFGITIQMFWNDHNPPHFHATYGDTNAIIDIKELKVIEGDLSRRTLNLVLDWTELHQQELLEAWDSCVNEKQPQKIEPLR